jgi:hypothetical protein
MREGGTAEVLESMKLSVVVFGRSALEDGLESRSREGMRRVYAISVPIRRKRGGPTNPNHSFTSS